MSRSTPSSGYTTPALGSCARHGRPLDPAAVEQLQTAAVTGAERRAANLARAHNWRTIMIAAAVLVGGVVAGVAGGYWFGRNAREPPRRPRSPPPPSGTGQALPRTGSGSCGQTTSRRSSRSCTGKAVLMSRWAPRVRRWSVAR